MINFHVYYQALLIAAKYNLAQILMITIIKMFNRITPVYISHSLFQ